jgi:hypothetical protein
MIIAIIGEYDTEHRADCLRGNGKTCVMSDALIKDKVFKGRRIIANYHLKGAEYMSSKQIVNLIMSEEIENVSVGIDEIGSIIGSLGESKDDKKFWDNFIKQTRKLTVDVYYTDQIFMNVFNRIRKQTDIKLIPRKFHLHVLNKGGKRLLKLTRCIQDNCNQRHIIKVFKINEGAYAWQRKEEYLYALRPEIVGKLYNTKELIKEGTQYKKEVEA